MARVIFSPFSARTLVLASITSHLNYLSTPLIRLPASILALFSRFSNEQLKLSCWNKSYHSNLCSKPPMPSPLTQSKWQCPLWNPRGPVGFGAPCVFGLTSQGSPPLCSMATLTSWVFMNIPGTFSPRGLHICCSRSLECSLSDICVACLLLFSGVKCHLLGDLPWSPASFPPSTFPTPLLILSSSWARLTSIGTIYFHLFMVYIDGDVTLWRQAFLSISSFATSQSTRPVFSI